MTRISLYVPSPNTRLLRRPGGRPWQTSGFPAVAEVFKKLTVTAVLQESQLSAQQTSWISQERECVVSAWSARRARAQRGGCVRRLFWRSDRREMGENGHVFRCPKGAFSKVHRARLLDRALHVLHGLGSMWFRHVGPMMWRDHLWSRPKMAWACGVHSGTLGWLTTVADYSWVFRHLLWRDSACFFGPKERIRKVGMASFFRVVRQGIQHNHRHTHSRRENRTPRTHSVFARTHESDNQLLGPI